jgi:hypothetical protein
MAVTKDTAKKRREKFLLALAECANVTKACVTSGLLRRTAYRQREADEAFAGAWDKALDEGAGILEDEAVRRAYEGTLKPVFYKGEECGAIREYSDTLLIFLLKAHKPEKYKDRQHVEHDIKGGVLVVPGVNTEEDWNKQARKQQNGNGD